MADHDSLPAELFTDGQLSADRADLIAGALTALGVSVRVKILPRRRSASDLQWLVLAALPLQAFLTSIGGNFADDAYKGFQDAVRKLLHREHAAEQAAVRPMVLQDTDSGLQIVLDHDLPADGYQQLLSLDLSRFRLGPLHYDRSQQRWRSELDEAAPPADPDPPGNQSGT
jgi:hypothetical protein